MARPSGLAAVLVLLCAVQCVRCSYHIPANLANVVVIATVDPQNPQFVVQLAVTVVKRTCVVFGRPFYARLTVPLPTPRPAPQSLPFLLQRASLTAT